ncbi:hypothetical protein I3842_03G127700 [Carya illinoinensis]|uniref:Root meristem growth factor 9 n=1 Tax=Carya illinoinensis TaxID=32201 RepID=A0A922JZG9_CARIL|nr:hypothetical protein I3842_03G127700 [Carya illinoinensis]
MAAVSCKRQLVLVAFMLLCFFSVGARAARSLRAITTSHESQTNLMHDDKFSPKEDRAADSDDLVAAADYTPARRKPPIHN